MQKTEGNQYSHRNSTSQALHTLVSGHKDYFREITGLPKKIDENSDDNIMLDPKWIAAFFISREVWTTAAFLYKPVSKHDLEPCPDDFLIQVEQHTGLLDVITQDFDQIVTFQSELTLLQEGQTGFTEVHETFSAALTKIEGYVSALSVYFAQVLQRLDMVQRAQTLYCDDAVTCARLSAYTEACCDFQVVMDKMLPHYQNMKIALSSHGAVSEARLVEDVISKLQDVVQKLKTHLRND